MSVYTLGAVPARTLNLRRKPSARATSSAARVMPSPTSSRTGLPGALAPPPPRTLNLRKKPIATTPAPVLNKRRAPGSAPAPAPSGGGGIASGEPGWYAGGDALETFVPSGGGGGGGGFAPAADVRPLPEAGGDMSPKDGIPLWAAIGGIALCAVVGFALLQRQGVV